VRFAYRKKKFLAPASGDTSSILLEAEDSQNGQKHSSQYTVAITDNHGRVNLDFYLGTARHRRQSMKKVDLLITQLVRFGSVLMKESQAIERASKTPRKNLLRNGRRKMQLRIFSAEIEPGTTDSDAFELEVNSWLHENPDIMVISYDISTTPRDGKVGMVLELAHEIRPEGLPEGVTFPQFQPQFR
jgi:hypothetical protein